MTVFELARRAGISPASVRLYARAGTLRPHRLPDGRQGYDEADAALIRAIVGLRRLGVAPERLAAAARVGESRDEAIGGIRRALEQQRRSVARTRGRLDEIDAWLVAVAGYLAGSGEETSGTDGRGGVSAATAAANER